MSTLNAGTLNVTNTLKLPNYTTTQRNALSPAVGTMIFNTTDTIVEVWNGSEWAPAGGASETFIVASGGTVTESGNYKIHTFNSSAQNFTVSQVASDAANNNVEYLVVAGGGGGGGFGSGLNGNFGSAGGGGAGGLLYSGGYNFPVAAQTYTVNVGGGGTGGTGNGMGADGGGSQFGSISATGGISDAFISPGPFASRINFFVVSDELFNANDLTFKTISVTSSLIPLIEVNSWRTPSI